MNRLSLLHKLDDLLEICKTCEKNSGIESPEKRCKGCQTYSEIKYIGENLGRKNGMAKISQETYQLFKEEGLSDKDVAKEVGMNHQYLSQLKKQWGIRPTLSRTDELQPSETKTTKEDKTTEYERLIQALRNDLKEAHTQLDEKDEVLRKYENVNAACEDVESETTTLREEKEKLQGEYNKLITNQYHKDYTIENQKEIIKNCNKTLERYEKENKALRALVEIWI